MTDLDVDAVTETDPGAPATPEAAPPRTARVRPPGEGTRTLRLPHAAATITESRGLLAADLRERRLTEAVIAEAETVVTELVTNAVIHARPLADGCVRVRWKVKNGAVEIEISDGGAATYPKPSPQAPWATSGRGLRIVRSIAHEWGVQDDKNGRTVWAAVGGPSRRRRL